MSWSVVPVVEVTLGVLIGGGSVLARRADSRALRYAVLGALLVAMGWVGGGLSALEIGLVPPLIGGAILVGLSTREVEAQRHGLACWLIGAALLAASLATPDVEPTMFAAALIGTVALAGASSRLGVGPLLLGPRSLGPLALGVLASWAVVLGSRGRPPAMVGAFGCFVVLVALAALVAVGRVLARRQHGLIGATPLWVAASLALGIPIARNVGLFDSWSTPLLRLAAIVALVIVASALGLVVVAAIGVARGSRAAAAERRSARASV